MEHFARSAFSLVGIPPVGIQARTLNKQYLVSNVLTTNQYKNMGHNPVGWRLEWTEMCVDTPVIYMHSAHCGCQTSHCKPGNECNEPASIIVMKLQKTK